MALKPRPPTVRDYGPRLLGNPFEFAMAILVLVSMLSTAELLLSPAYHRLPPVGLAAIPAWLLWVWVAVGTASGVLVIVGLTWGTLKARARSLEALGLWFGLLVWSSVAVADIITEPAAWNGWVQYAAFALGCGLRLYAMHRYERAVTRAMERIENEQDAGADGAA